jgi:hypothetical protein
MTPWNVEELTGLLSFYNSFFAKNLKNKEVSLS